MAPGPCALSLPGPFPQTRYRSDSNRDNPCSPNAANYSQVSLLLLMRQESLSAYAGRQLMLIMFSGLTSAILAGIQLLGNPQTQRALQWSPWLWFILLIFPLVAFKTWRIRHSHRQHMLDVE
jgi:hypothetical protein